MAKKSKPLAKNKALGILEALLFVALVALWYIILNR